EDEVIAAIGVAGPTLLVQPHGSAEDVVDWGAHGETLAAGLYRGNALTPIPPRPGPRSSPRTGSRPGTGLRARGIHACRHRQSPPPRRLRTVPAPDRRRG